MGLKADRNMGVIFETVILLFVNIQTNNPMRHVLPRDEKLGLENCGNFSYTGEMNPNGLYQED